MSDKTPFPTVIPLPIMGETKPIQMVDSMAIANVERAPGTNDWRIVLAIAHQSAPRGLGLPMQVPEALHTIQLLTNGVRDARRLAIGLKPGPADPDRRFAEDEPDDGTIPNMVEREWTMFEAAVVPIDAPDMQKREMKLAFFAGYHSLMGALQNMLDPESEPTERDLAQMSAIDAELRAFKDAYIAEETARRDPVRH